MQCRICSGAFGKQDSALYLCGYRDGFVHQGCCHNNCSWDHSPCQHKITTFVNAELPK